MTQFADVPLAEIQRINAEAAYPASLFQDHGAIDRFGYLKDLADDAGIDFSTLSTILTVMPPEEDIDGLVTMLEDFNF